MSEEQPSVGLIETRPTTLVESNGKSDGKSDFEPLFAYLQSEQGHQVATRILEIIEGIKKVTIDRTHAHAKFDRWLQAGVIMSVVAAVVILSVEDKLNPTAGVALGSIAGYFFGKSK